MKDKESRALRRLDKSYGDELRRAIRRLPACCGDPNELAMNAFKRHVTQLITNGKSPLRPLDNELTTIYGIARGLVGEQYGKRRAEHLLPGRELAGRAQGRIKWKRADLSAALAKLRDEELEAFLLGLPSEYCDCGPERCMHKFTFAEIAVAMGLTGRDQARALWKTAQEKLENDPLLAKYKAKGDAR